MEVIKLHSSNTCRFRKHHTSFLRFFSFASSALQSSTFRYSFCTCTSKSISFQAESGAMVEVVRQERVAFFFNQRIVEFSVLHDCFEPKLVLVRVCQVFKVNSNFSHRMEFFGNFKYEMNPDDAGEERFALVFSKAFKRPLTQKKQRRSWLRTCSTISIIIVEFR